MPRTGDIGKQSRTGRGVLLLQAAGEALVTLGAIVLLFAAFQLHFTGLYTGKEQSALAADLEQAWARPEPAARPVTAPVSAAPAPAPAGHTEAVTELGKGVAVLRAPRLGEGWQQVAVEGVDKRALRRGPGHYPGTAMPGELGNSVFSGHRTTYGAPFNEIHRLREGDDVVVETRDAVHVYRVIRQHIVRPWQADVTYPVPGQPGAMPTKRLLTFTTCHPEYSDRQRLIVVAELHRTEPKSASPG